MRTNLVARSATLIVAAMLLTSCSPAAFELDVKLNDIPMCEDTTETISPEELTLQTGECNREGQTLKLPNGKSFIVPDFGRVTEGLDSDDDGMWAYMMVNLGAEGVFLTTTRCDGEEIDEYGTEAARARVEANYGDRVKSNC